MTPQPSRRAALLALAVTAAALAGGCHPLARSDLRYAGAPTPSLHGVSMAIGPATHAFAPQAPFDETPIGPVETAGAAAFD